ncbi:MAG TPA: hypothetical protein VIO36_02950 [Anaerolineaceae bacterium]
MVNGSYRLQDDKAVLRIKDRICDSALELLSSGLFFQMLEHSVAKLARRNSRLLDIFEQPQAVNTTSLCLLVDTLKMLTRLSGDLVPHVVPGSAQFFRDRGLFNAFVEYLYNDWRAMQRLIICDSQGEAYDQRPYHTFNNTIESLTHLVRSTYRDIQENITGSHPRIYRQVRAGAEIAAIALPKEIPYPNGSFKHLNGIAIIRQVLIYPPLIFNPPMNKRSGVFERVQHNPLDFVNLEADQWLCYPAKVGPLVVLVYFTLNYFELGFALCNLFELADDEDLQRRPDAVYLFGVPAAQFPRLGRSQTIFYDDGTPDGVLVGAVPDSPEFGYFGYLKKMILTLHNIKMMKLGRLPFHGAMVTLTLHDRRDFTILILGDTGAGKSETLEALRTIAGDHVSEITIIADDMGSLERRAGGALVGYGTETGAFVRLDDLQPGYAFGQIDRMILMSATQVNARVVIPVTTYAAIMKGSAPNLVLYANNYEAVDAGHPIIEPFASPQAALDEFRAGKVMSKGTTTTTGLVGTYFANVFGPEQYQEMHEPLAQTFFNAFFERGIPVGQIRTQLGRPGQERSGPEAAARALLEWMQNHP